MSRAAKTAATPAGAPAEVLTSDPLRVLSDLDRWMQGSNYASDHPWRAAVAHALKVASFGDEAIPEGDLDDFGGDETNRKLARSWWGSLTSRGRVFWRGEGARETLAAAWKEFNHHARYWHAFQQSHAAPKPEHDAKKLFAALQNIDGVSHEYAADIAALAHAARKLVHCNADSLIALDGLLGLIEDRVDLWATSIESDAEEVGAHEKGGPHIQLLVRLYDEQRAVREGGAA